MPFMPEARIARTMGLLLVATFFSLGCCGNQPFSPPNPPLPPPKPPETPPRRVPVAVVEAKNLGGLESFASLNQAEAEGSVISSWPISLRAEKRTVDECPG